jgi:type IV pilus assembly protein PilN
MIPINLLPHRAQRRKGQQRQFFVLAGMTVGLGAAIVIAVHGLFATRIENQLQRNKYLQTEIAALDKQIDEIKKLKEQTQALLARKRVVETLQINRTETVRLLDQMVRQLPDGASEVGEADRAEGQRRRLCNLQCEGIDADAQSRGFAVAGSPDPG